MPVDYTQLLRELLKEREAWALKKNEAERELSRLAELIRATYKMITPEQRAQCFQPLVEHMETMYSPGLTNLIRGAFFAGKEWITPMEIREYLKSVGFNFENYKSNPLASIHAILRRMIPSEIECKTSDGKKLYRLKTVEHFGASMLEDVRGWLAEKGDKTALEKRSTQRKPIKRTRAAMKKHT